MLSEECDSSRAIQFLTTQHHEELNLQSSPFTYSLCSKNICLYEKDVLACVFSIKNICYLCGMLYC